MTVEVPWRTTLLSILGLEGAEMRRNSLPYLVRGIMGIIVAVTLFQQLFYFEASTFWIYLGLYFIANGILSLRAARSALGARMRNSIIGPLISIIGGAVMVVAYPFSAYRATLIPTEAGKVVVGVIVSAIGLMDFLGRVRLTVRPTLSWAQRLFGGLEILLGLTLIAIPISWQSRLISLAWISIALVWIVPVTVYMFLIAYRNRVT